MLKLNSKSFLATSIRIFLTACFCTMIFISNVLPAAAAMSRPDQGEAQLNEIQKRTDELTKRTDDISNKDRSVAPSLKQAQSATKKGINEIQGDADKEKMISPEDAKNTNTIEKKIDKALSKVKGN